MRELIDTYDRVRDALTHVSADCCRDDWVRIAAAINSEWADDKGFALFDSWSQSAPERYNYASAVSTWRSLNPGGSITIATLFAAAKSNGWRDESNSRDEYRKGHNPRSNSAPAPGGVYRGSCAPPNGHHAPPPPSEPKIHVPENELKALWSLCRGVADDADAARWCAIRGLDASRIDEREDARVISQAAAQRAPKWLPKLPVTRRQYAPGRLLIPLYDEHGVFRSVSGRIVDAVQNEAGVSSVKMKASRPVRPYPEHPGFIATGLCMMNTVFYQLITLGDGETPPSVEVVIVEGEPDFLTRCETRPGAAVCGIYSGAWKQPLADRIPDGALVYIETDRDKQGHHYAEQIAKTLGGRCLIFRLRADLPEGDINDLHKRGELRAPADQCEPYVPEGSRAPTNESEPNTADGTGRPVHLDGRDQLCDTLIAIWRHLTARNVAILARGEVRPNEEPLFLTPDSELARVAWTPTPEGLTQLTIERMSLAHVLHLLAFQFHWFTIDKKGERHNKDPKTSAVTLVHSAARNAPTPPPVIHTIARTPVYGSDGTPIYSRGYHASEHLWYEPDECLAALPTIPEHPSDAAITRAKELLSEAIGDFPFTGEAERATIYAAILLPFVRRMIQGPTPIHLIEAPVQGSGKTLLASIVSIISTGEAISPIVLNANEEETQKALAAELSRGRGVIVIDNLDTSRGPLNSPAFAMVATQTTPSFRRLGSNGPDAAMVLPNQALWLVTGNNVQVSQDLIRRFIRSRLDPGLEKPHLRSQSAFRHPNIVAWVHENRMQLVWSVLVLCQAWIANGKRPGPQNLGSYEAWAATIGGILDNAGIKGFLGNAQDFYGFANNEADAWGPFLEAWWERYGSIPTQAKSLNSMCEPLQYMAATRGDKGELSQSRRLAQAIKNAHGRVMGGFKLCARENSHTKNLEYSLEPVGEAPPTQAAQAPTQPVQTSMFQDSRAGMEWLND